MEETEQQQRLGQTRYMGLAAIIGILVGFAGAVFHLLIDWLIEWPNWLATVIEGPWLVVIAALLTMVITIASVYLVHHYAPEAGGSGVQEIEGALEGLRQLHWRRVLPVKFFAGLFSISSGLVLGREGPTIHIGGSIAAAISEFSRCIDFERRGLLAAGAAGGLAAAFNAPLAAVLFVIEETHRQFPYTFRTYMGVIIASCLAAAVVESFAGVEPDLNIPLQVTPLWVLPAFFILGCLLGLIGVLLNAALLAMADFGAACHARAPYAYAAIVGLLTGALFVLVPWSVSGGEKVIEALANQPPAFSLLLGLGILRFITTVTSYSTGVPGGIFAPILTLATCLGLAFGQIVDGFLPGTDIAVSAFAVAAMGGLFTASVRAPIVGVALALELTGSYALLLPVMVTCVTANIIAHWAGGRPIYEQLLDRTLARAGIDPRAAASREPIGLG
ncbi:H(+)/Cl(-) exchange transporter ClcA [Rhodoligotrophos ferricapiens]|uniref:H(+)/Cl(-) exchange transporter ClcA n=1 Tax=Rhodoligotrophos ferricapiens TaxID=3069264 RepID=UPI00315D3EBD